MRRTNIIAAILFFTFISYFDNEVIAQMKTTCHLKDTIELSGRIAKLRYNSRISGDEKEYFNDSYNLMLKEPLVIYDPDNNNELYRDIDNVEIINHYDFEIYQMYGKQVVITGLLDKFVPREGYYRQYSTPVYISVTSVEVKE